MAWELADNFEGTLSNWANTTAAVTTDASAAFSGTKGLRQVATTTVAGVASLSDATLPDGYEFADIRCRFRHVSHASGNSPIITVQNRTGSDHADLFWNWTVGTPRVWLDVKSTDNAQFDLVQNQWYYLRMVVGFGGTTWTARVWINGVLVADVKTTGKPASDVRTIHVGGFGPEENTRHYDNFTAYLTHTDPAPELPASETRGFSPGQKVELDLAGWTDITGDVYERDPITITRGRTGSGGQSDPARATMTIGNRGGKFSPRNPMSPHYGLLQRNTPIRITTAGGPTKLVNSGEGSVTTSATPAMGVTDLDARVEFDYRPEYASLNFLHLVGRSYSSTAVSWYVDIHQGVPRLIWSTDGTTSSTLLDQATGPLPYTGRIVLRVTLDVNNGASGHTTKFYLSDTTSGPWTQIGTSVTTAGTTTIANTVAPLRIGYSPPWAGTSYPGPIHRALLMSGIDGTTVASPDFTAMSLEDTSYLDAQGNWWTLGENATLDDRRYRFYGEVSKWPQTWDVAGKDQHVKITAYDIRRRLTMNPPSLRSPMFRTYSDPARTDILAYWPLEDAAEATQMESGRTGGYPMGVIPGAQLAGDSGWTASDPLPILETGEFSGYVRPKVGANDQISVRMFVWHAAQPAADSPLIKLTTTAGMTATLRMRPNGAGSTLSAFRVWDSDGTLKSEEASIILNLTSFGYVILELTFEMAGTTGVFWELRIRDFTNTDRYGDYGGVTGRFTGFAANTTMGYPRRVTLGGYPGVGQTTVGHVVVSDQFEQVADTNNDTLDAVAAWNGETPVNRLYRIAAEEGVPLFVVHKGTSALPNRVTMGDQPNDTLVGLLDEAAESDGGILYSSRDAFRFEYRTRDSLFNRPAVTLDYATGQVAGDLAPVDDDSELINDATIERRLGARYRAVQETGPLSVAAPPAGVGSYSGEQTLSLETDDQLYDAAMWRLALGVVDEARYPQLSVNLHSPRVPTELRAALLDSDVGEWLEITGLPWDVTTNSVQIVQGYTEVIRLKEHTLTFNCLPASPYRTAVADATPFGRVAGSGSAITSAYSTSATALDVAPTATGARWTDAPADLPYDVVIAGERCTVTAVATRPPANPNPDMVPNITGWSPSGSTLLRSTVVVPHGHDASLKITPDGVSAGGGAGSPLVPVTANAPYLASAWLFGTTGWGVVWVLVNWYTAAGAFISSSTGPAADLPMNAWVEVKNQFTSPATAGQAAIWVWFGGTPANTDWIYATDVRLDAGASSDPQTLTVTRAVNGVSKTLPSGTAVTVAETAKVRY